VVGANDAPENTDRLVSGTMPTGTGGTIAPGKYFVTESELYPGGTGAVQRNSRDLIVVSGSTMRIHQTDAMSDLVAGADFLVNGSTIVLTYRCPDSMKGQSSGAIPFTATETTLTLFDTKKMRVSVYTKQ
jgi:hypothetical protein